MFVVYLHKNKINNKVYIGQTCQIPPSKRWNPSNYIHNQHFYNAINKYGWNNFQHIILKQNLTLDQANEKQAYWIKFYNSLNPNKGYNLRPGGNNSLLTEQTKKKMSLNHRDVSGEKNYFYNKHFCGKDHPFYEKHHSQESKQKISQNGKNKGGKKVKCIQTNEIFVTAAEAARQYDLANGSHISECCRGKRKTTKGFHWEFVK